MKLIDRVNEQIGVAMRAKDQVQLDALRMLKTALVNRRIDRGHELDEAEAQQVVTSLVKQRRDAIEQFEKAGRQELADKERREMQILETYLPPPVRPEELAEAVEAAIAETGASSVKDLGRVMKAVMPKLAGRSVDGKAVNDQVRQRLSGAGSAASS